jgi:hypothetical protein
LFKLQKKSLSIDTQNALMQIAHFIAVLAHYFKLDSEDKLFNDD